MRCAGVVFATVGALWGGSVRYSGCAVRGSVRYSGRSCWLDSDIRYCMTGHLLLPTLTLAYQHIPAAVSKRSPVDNPPVDVWPSSLI